METIADAEQTFFIVLVVRSRSRLILYLKLGQVTRPKCWLFHYRSVFVFVFWLIKQSEGFSKFNKIYEYEYNLFDQNCKMTMTSVSGHLLNYEFVSAFKKW